MNLYSAYLLENLLCAGHISKTEQDCLEELFKTVRTMRRIFQFVRRKLDSTQVYWNTVAGWLKEIKYIKTNKTVKVSEVKTIKRTCPYEFLVQVSWLCVMGIILPDACVCIVSRLYYSKSLPRRPSLILCSLHVSSLISAVSQLYGLAASYSNGLLINLYDFSATMALVVCLTNSLVYEECSLLDTKSVRFLANRTATQYDRLFA